MRIILICAVLFIAFFGGLITRVGVPPHMTAATELIIIVLFLTAPLGGNRHRRYVTHMWYLFAYMLIIAGCSIVINGFPILNSVYSLRLLFRFYFFYLAIATLDLDDDTIKRINLVIAIFLLLQLPVVAYNYTIYGISELTIGAYAKIGGTITTILPIIVIFYSAGYYILYRPHLRYIIFAMGFILFSIVGKKRAVLFLYPAQFVAIYYYIYFKGMRVRFSRKIGAMVMILTIVVTISSAILYLNPTLNPENKVGGSIDPEYAIDYAKDYTTRMNPFGYSLGRYTTTVRIFRSLWESGFVETFFGLGPGIMTQSLFDPEEQKKNIATVKNRFKFQYGLTAMTRIAIEYGVLASITYLLILIFYARMAWKYYKSETVPYWKAFAAGSVGFAYSTIFFFFAYGDSILWGDTIPALYFWAMAVVYTRSKRIGDEVP